MDVSGGVWLVADLAAGTVRSMEHEGDYNEEEVLVHVTVENGRVFAQLHERVDD